MMNVYVKITLSEFVANDYAIIIIIIILCSRIIASYVCMSVSL